MNTNKDKSIAEIQASKQPLPDAVILLADGSRGVYIPQFFGQSCNEGWHGISDNMRACLLAGPDDPDGLYWDHWSAVLDNAYWERNGFKWRLHQDGDLWAYCEARMSNEEKRNFGIDVDPFEYVIDLDERGEFKATVYDSNGLIVFNIEGFDIFEDGFMAHKNDMAGLKSYLVDLRIMHENDDLTD